MIPDDTHIETLRWHMGEMLVGGIFFFVGSIACLMAMLRRRANAQLLVWFGLFIGLYGARMLAYGIESLNLAPGSPWPVRLEVIVNYFVAVPAFLFWASIGRSHLRRACQFLALAGLGSGAFGVAWYFIYGSPDAFVRYSFLIAIFGILALGTLNLFPSLVKRYMTIQSPAMAIAMPVMAAVTLYVNVRLFLGYPPPRFVEPMGFAMWISAIGYEAVRRTFDGERRLLSIENELATARQIQFSILPDSVPQVSGLRIAASYNPMTAVAGDFYQFTHSGDHQVGILLADVTGHGVPAALIASMIKVAMQSAAAVASDPGKVLQTLNRILTPELKGRLTSAAYLWVDGEARRVRYSAAGHPPLVLWKAASGEVAQVASNGLLFGIADNLEYPVWEHPLCPGDRLLLYTDGLVEPENARGESFGDAQLEAIVRKCRSVPASELLEQLLVELRRWQTRGATQQDDITLAAVEVL